MLKIQERKAGMLLVLKHNNKVKNTKPCKVPVQFILKFIFSVKHLSRNLKRVSNEILNPNCFSIVLVFPGRVTIPIIYVGDEGCSERNHFLFA